MFKALPVLVALLAGQPLQSDSTTAPPPAHPQPAAADSVDFKADEFNGMTVPIVVNGVAHRFLVDSGSERSAISAELARQLGIVPSGGRMVTGLAGKFWVPTVTVSSLGFARGKKHNLQALMFSRYAIGADGLLGNDVLAQQLVDFDFANNRMTLRRAPLVPGPAPGAADTTLTLKMHRQKGRLVFTHARAARASVGAVLDTGSTITIGNQALRNLLARRNRLGRTVPVKLVAVTGELVPAELGVASEVVIGGVVFHDLPIAFATLEPFVQLGFTNKPAMLVGMNALSAFDRVAIDFRNKQASFTLRGELGTPNLNIRSTAW